MSALSPANVATLMFKRQTPKFPHLRSFLSHLESGGDFLSTNEPVGVKLEASALHQRLLADGGPAVLVERPLRDDGTAYDLGLLINLFGTRQRVAAGLGLEPSGLAGLGEFLSFLRSPKPPRNLSDFRDLLPVAKAGLSSRPKLTRQDRHLEDVDPDLGILPVQTCWPGDAGPLITWPIVITRPPGADDPRDYNLGVYRMQVLDGQRAILRWLPFRGGAQHYREWSRTNEPMPVAVVIGCDPATLLSAVLPAPGDVGELTLAGVLQGEASRLVPCSNIAMHVPASAEIVLEGTVRPGDMAMEGPFGDHTGYYNDAASYPVFHLEAMKVRRGAPYLSTFTGRAPDEPSVIGEAMIDVFLPLLKQAIPEIRDLHLPPATCSYRTAVLQIDKSYPGQARRVMMGFWSLLPQFSMTKYIIVVDADVDIRDWDEVMWAVATRSDPERDLLTINSTPVDQLDFASPREGLGGKLGIDATVKIGTETQRPFAEALRMPADVVARAETIFSRIVSGRTQPIRRNEEVT